VLGVINYGSGNFRSVCNALEFLKIEYVPISSAKELRKTSHIILPGVGSYKNCMSKLDELEILEPLKQEILDEKKFFLGICVGHQILSTLGSEFEKVPGLDIIEGITSKITTDIKLPVPHIGWSEVYRKRESELFNEIEDGATFYFVHSYNFDVKDKRFVSSITNYGGEITASVEKNNIFGVQFHPEKSQKNGLKLLENFSKLH